MKYTVRFTSSFPGRVLGKSLPSFKKTYHKIGPVMLLKEALQWNCKEKGLLMGDTGLEPVYLLRVKQNRVIRKSFHHKD